MQVTIMSEKPTYEKLEQRIQELEQAESERKLAEEALRESEAKLLEAQSVARIGNWAWDLQTNKLSWSEENYRIFGLPLEVSPSYETFEKTIHPEDRAFVNKSVEDALKRKKPYNIEFRIILPDDKEGIVHAIGTVDYDKEDKPLRFFGTVQDINERKRAEKTLQRSEALLNATQQLTKVGGWEWDVEKQTMFWTDEVYRIHDFQPSEFTPGSTKHIERGIECYDSEDRPVIMAAFRRCVEKGQAYDLEFPFTTAMGRRIWIRTVADPVLKGDRVVRVVGNIMDITERKQTFEAFKEQKEFSEKIIKTSRAIIVGLDKNHKIRIFNRGAEKITGFKSKEVIGNDWFKIFFKPEIYDEMVKVWEDAWGVKFHSYVNPIRSKNGDEKIISWQTAGMYDGADETKHMLISIGEDITARKQAEEELRESEERFRQLAENIEEVFWIVSPDWKEIYYISPAYEKVWGRSCKSLGERPISWMESIVEEDRDKVIAYIEEKQNGDLSEISFPEYRIVGFGGTIRWISARGFSVYNEHGETYRIVGIAEDITENKQAEIALRESEEKYRSMMEAMKDQVYICSPDYRVEYMNPAMIRMIGHDATGEHCFKALHDLDEKCPWCVHNRIQQGECVEIDVVSPKNNRSYNIFHSPIVHEDGSISNMTVYRDTTDFKKMETQLQQAQKMEAIGTLAGGIAHDFNNILSPMFGYLEMMLADVPADNPLRGHLAEVFNGAKRARDLVKQILVFSRQTEQEKKPMKVQLVIKEVLKLIRSSLPTTICIRQDISNECGLVMADPTQIHQITMNLITNAYHAMEETGGKLTVTLKQLELTAEDLKDPAMVPGPHVCLTVADTGPGMDQGIIARIFDPYFTTKEEGKGTGLGLAVVHGIVQSHGGHISVYSDPGKGTEFKVYLPVIKPQEAAQNIKADLPIQKGNERILLVDDQDVIVQMERQMIERLGYHVTARTSSTDALEAFRTQPNKFDLVITDMTMPNMMGAKLSGELMKIRSDIPVILCTGFSEMMSKEKAESLGIKGFLVKPIEMKDLSKKIREVLDGQ
jgi:PAS domain S-box-containing protein